MIYYLYKSHFILETTWPGLKNHILLAEGMVFEDKFICNNCCNYSYVIFTLQIY